MHQRKHGSPTGTAPGPRGRGGWRSPAVQRVLELQATAGNRATAPLVQRATPREAGSSEELRQLAAHPGNRMVARAGKPAIEPAPDGYNDIGKKAAGTGGSLGTPAGLTLIPNAAAFTTPRLKTTPEYKRTSPGSVEHYVTVGQPDPSPDVVLDCWYLGPGRHHWGSGAKTLKHKGKMYEAVIEVSQAISDLIKAGEQEHLDDAKQAYDMTYGLIVTRMQSLAGKRFGPATTPDNAYSRALNALSDLLPPELSVRPPATVAVWYQALDAMLGQSKPARDGSGFHGLDYDQSHVIWDATNGQAVYPVATNARTKIPSDPSSAVIHYPSATPARGSPGVQPNPVTILRQEEAEDEGADESGPEAAEDESEGAPSGPLVF